MILNGSRVQGFNIKVSVNLRIASDDLSGQSSSSSRSAKGFKPKTLNCGLMISFNDKRFLSDLLAQAEAVDDNAEPSIYNIIDQTANALNIRQVQFDDNFNVKEQESIKAWAVTFVLKEYLSIPEKKEQRQTAQAVAQQESAGNPVTPQVAVDDNQQLSSFENILKNIETSLS